MHDKPSTRRGFLLTAGIGAVALAAPAQAQQDNHEHPPLTSAEKEQQAFTMMALKMYVEVDSDDTNGAVAMIRVFVPPGAGGAPHIHSREDEIHTVVRGHYRYRHGDHELEAGPGTVVFMPRGIPHVFRNVGDEPAEHVVTAIPGGLEKMFREISAAKVQMPKDAAKVVEIFGKYGLTILPPSALPLSDGH